MKKLCYFVNSAWYFELHWLERAEAAVRAGYEVSVIARFDDVNLKTKLEEKGISCFNSNIQEKKINPIEFIFDCIRLYKILDAIDCDILHCITIKPGIISCLWSRARGKPLIYSFVGLGRVFNNNTIKFKVIRFLIKHLYKNVLSDIKYKMIFEHIDDQTKIINLLHIDTQKTIVIDGAGVDTELFAFNTEPSCERIKVLFAGRLLWSKGLADLIEARKLLKNKNINFDLIVAGMLVEDDSDAIDLKYITKWHDSKEIVWLGKIDDMPNLISQSNIVALPSTYPEGIPRILLESGAVGRPCVVYHISGCSSLIKNSHNGYTVAPGNIIELASRLEYLITHDVERKDMGRKARDYIESRYSSNIIIDKTLKVYNDML